VADPTVSGMLMLPEINEWPANGSCNGCAFVRKHLDADSPEFKHRTNLCMTVGNCADVVWVYDTPEGRAEYMAARLGAS
jgi:hypothetical protein